MAPEPEAVMMTSLDVRDRLVEALKLDLIGPWPGHALGEERLPGHIRPAPLQIRIIKTGVRHDDIGAGRGGLELRNQLLDPIRMHPRDGR